MKKTLVATLLLIGISQVQAQDGYEEYYNGRYNFKVSYPAGIFIPTGESQNGDGQHFVSRNGDAVITVSGIWNGILDVNENGGDAALPNGMRDNCHLKTKLNDNEEIDKVTYKNQKGNVATYSGYYGHDIVYVKAIAASSPEGSDEYFAGDRCVTLHMKYPAKYKEEYDEIITNVANSFKVIK